MMSEQPNNFNVGGDPNGNPKDFETTKPDKPNGQSWSQRTRSSDTPIGVQIIAVLHLFGAVIIIAGVLLSILTHRTFLGYNNFVSILLGIICSAVGIGLLSLKKWSRWLTIILYGVSVLQHIAGIFSGSLTIRTFVGILISIVVIAYLTLPGVKKAFTQGQNG